MIVYIVGPYRAATESGVRANIERARAVAEAVWRAGFVALCPHLNSAFMGGIVTDHAFLSGGIELLRQCAAVVTVPGWEDSCGSQFEIQAAGEIGIPIYYDIQALCDRHYSQAKHYS